MTPLDPHGAAGTLALLTAGSAAGLVGSMLGVGGGVFIVPTLVLLFGLPMPGAVAASLLAVVATSSASSASHLSKGTVNIRLGIVLETATVLGALCGAALAALVPERPLVAAFGLLLGVVCVLLWRRAETEDEGPSSEPAGLLGEEYLDAATGRRVRYAVRRLPLALGTSFAAGNLSALLGIGGGVLKVPVLHLFCGLPMKASAATSTFMLGVTASAGVFAYAVRGRLDPVVAGTVALGVFGGSWLGTRLLPKTRDAGVRRLFALLCAFLALQMLRRALHG